MELDRDAILSRLRKLARRDRRRRVFGAAAHDYRLNPPLDVAQIEAFENQHQIALPQDYRCFITEIGNGGAGPAHGLFPFGHDDEGRWGAALPIGELGEPFPHTTAWNLDDAFWQSAPDVPEGMPSDEEDRLWEEWSQVLEPRYWDPALVNGAIPICHLGCCLRQWLVVHGEQRGYIWDDLRADHAGLVPVGKQVTFTDWYLSWLDEAERGGKKQPIDKVSYRVRQPGPRRRELFTLFLLIVAGALLGLILALL